MAESVKPSNRPRQKISADASLLVQTVMPNQSNAKKEYKGYGGYEKYARPKSRRQQYRDVRTPTHRNSRNQLNKQDSHSQLQSMQVQGVNPNASKENTMAQSQEVPERPRTSRGRRPGDAALEGQDETPRPRTGRGSRKENVAPESIDSEEERPKTSRGKRQAGVIVQQSVDQATHEQSEQWLQTMKEGQMVGSGANTDQLDVWTNNTEAPVANPSETVMQVPDVDSPRPSSRRLRPKSAKGRSRPPCTDQDIAMWSNIREDKSGTATPDTYVNAPLSPQSSSLYQSVQVSPRDTLLYHQPMTSHRPPSGSQQLQSQAQANTSPQHSLNLSDSQRLTYEWQQRQYQAAASQQDQGLSTPHQDSSLTKYAPLPAIGDKNSQKNINTPEKVVSANQSKPETRKDKSESLGAQIRKKASQPYANRQKQNGKGTPDHQSDSSKDTKLLNGTVNEKQNGKKSPKGGVPAATTKGKISPAQNAKKGKSPEKLFKPLERVITLAAEPTEDPRIHLAVRLPSGTRILRYFRFHDTLGAVLNFAEDSAKLDFSECWLASTAPVTVYKDMTHSIHDAGLENRTVLHIQLPHT